MRVRPSTEVAAGTSRELVAAATLRYFGEIAERCCRVIGDKRDLAVWMLLVGCALKPRWCHEGRWFEAAEVCRVAQLGRMMRIEPFPSQLSQYSACI